MEDSASLTQALMRQVQSHSRYGLFSVEAQRNLIAVGADNAQARGHGRGRLDPGVDLGFTRLGAIHGPQTPAAQPT